jgi:hypothetical protein
MADALEQDGAHDDRDAPKPPRSDLKDAAFWIVLGVATLAGSITMDRLENQNINPYTVPGLLPGLLAIAMILLGGVLALRSWRRGAGTQPLPPASPGLREERKRVAVVAALCCGYGVVLVGHGLPFWLASTIYVTGSILVLRRLSREPAERRLGARAGIQALVIGLVSSLVIHLVFQEVFLVRMP